MKDKTSDRLTRREFVTTLAGASAGMMIVPRRVPPAAISDGSTSSPMSTRESELASRMTMTAHATSPAAT